MSALEIIGVPPQMIGYLFRRRPPVALKIASGKSSNLSQTLFAPDQYFVRDAWTDRMAWERRCHEKERGTIDGCFGLYEDCHSGRAASAQGLYLECVHPIHRGVPGRISEPFGQKEALFENRRNAR